jgi:hypothetical protein
MLVSWTSWFRRSSRELSTRPKSKALTRWFIIVDRAKKRKSLARPDISHTRADPHLVWEDKHLPKDVVDLASTLSVEADVKDGVGISKQIH